MGKDDRAAQAGEEERAEEVDAVAMEAIRQALLATTLRIAGADRINPIGILGNESNARYFVKLSQGNDTVQDVVLFRYRDYHRDYEMLRVLEEVAGNLEALRVLTIRFLYGRRDEKDDDEDDPEVAESLYWQAFAGALSRVRHPIELRLDGDCCDDIYFTNFAVAIQGLPTIRTFRSSDEVPWEDANTLMSALASLPSLENVTLGCFYYERRSPGGEFPGLTNLLKSPSLRSIEFSGFNFTNS
jgi:hypothetical protein